MNMKLYINAATGAVLLSAASSFFSVEARVGQAHEAQREEGFPEQALLQTFRQVNCNIKFPADAELVYVSSSDDGVSHPRCEFHGNMLINDAPNGIWAFHGMKCKFKVKFSDRNGCICEVETLRFPSAYFIADHGCECIRITRCEGDRCPGDGNTGEWPCGGHDGCLRAPDVTLTVESSLKRGDT